MHQFLARHASQVSGVLSGFDRLIFRGYLRPITYATGMAFYLHCAGVLLKKFRSFAQTVTEKVFRRLPCWRNRSRTARPVFAWGG